MTRWLETLEAVCGPVVAWALAVAAVVVALPPVLLFHLLLDRPARLRPEKDAARFPVVPLPRQSTGRPPARVA